ncbi:MAG: DUF4214 domain-containing protein [Acidimicrobiales bacterium]
MATALVVVAGVGVGVAPAAAVDPPLPTAPGPMAPPVVAGASSTSLTVAWNAPFNDGGSAVTGYRLELFVGNDAEASQIVNLPGDWKVRTFTGLTPATRYKFRVAAKNAHGTGPMSALSADALPPFRSLEAFVYQQSLDFLGAPASAELMAAGRNELLAGRTPGSMIAGFSTTPQWQVLDPLTRIYYAYFLRIPDTNGLRYWLGQRRTGMTVARISSGFAASSEFQNTYGSLDNARFVRLVYRNVLGRDPDAGGLAYWTGKLDRRQRDRGEVMAQFSESSEHQRRRAGEVATVSVLFGMLGRAPSDSELSYWGPSARVDRSVLATALLVGAEYDARIPA